MVFDAKRFAVGEFPPKRSAPQIYKKGKYIRQTVSF